MMFDGMRWMSVDGVVDCWSSGGDVDVVCG